MFVLIKADKIIFQRKSTDKRGAVCCRLFLLDLHLLKNSLCQEKNHLEGFILPFFPIPVMFNYFSMLLNKRAVARYYIVTKCRKCLPAE